MPETIESILTKKILESPDLAALIDSRAEQKLRAFRIDQRFTRRDMAQMYQVSEQTIDRMTDEELKDRGFRRIKIGVSVRFERL